MRMEDLDGKRVKISAKTLTVKDEYGKTRGMVRGVTPFKSFTNRQRNNHFHAIGLSTVWCNKYNPDLTHNFIDNAGKLFFLYETSRLEFYEKNLAPIYEENEFFQREREYYEYYKSLPAYLDAAGVSVVMCYQIV